MGLGTFANKILNFNKLELPNTKKGYSSSGYRATANLNLPSTNFIVDGLPVYRNLSSQLYLLDCYENNPIVQSIINIKANAFSNIRFIVRDLKTGEELPLSEYEKDNGKINEMLSSPNPSQSTYEWLRQFKINFEVFGNAYMYAFVPVGYEDRFTYEDINTLNNLHNACLKPVLTGNWLEATTRQEIIKEYLFTSLNRKVRKINTNTVFHLNNANIRLDENFTEGVSDLISLRDPISNIEGAYESRNVMIRKRGALGILTSEKKDEALGTIPMLDDEIEEVQKAMSKYGGLDNQYQHIITPMPLKYQKMAMSVKDLMLFEEIEADAIAIANAKGVPELLVKYYIKGGTFENLDKSEKRLYDSTIIPEAKEFLKAFNNFLKTKDVGIELLGSFEHVKCLQINKKEEAETDRINEQTSHSAFMMGGIDYNEYLASIRKPNDPIYGELRVWDLDEDKLKILGLMKSNGNGKEQ